MWQLFPQTFRFNTFSNILIEPHSFYVSTFSEFAIASGFLVLFSLHFDYKYIQMLTFSRPIIDFCHYLLYVIPALSSSYSHIQSQAFSHQFTYAGPNEYP